MTGRQGMLLVPAGILVTLALLACSHFLPLGAVAIFAVAIPAAYIHMRLGSLAGGGVVVLVAAILARFAGYPDALSYLAQFGVLSFVLPLFLRRGVAWDRSVGLTLGLLVATGGLVLACMSLLGGMEIGALVEQHLQQEMQQVLTMIPQMDLPAEQAANFETLIRQTVEFFRRAWPAIAIIGLGGLAMVILSGLNVLSRGEYTFAGPPAQSWKLPEGLIWGLIGSGCGVLFGKGAVESVALNMLLVVLACYFLQGLAILGHYFRKNRIPPILRTLGYVLVVTLNPLPVIVTGLGVFDLWVDFRKPRKTKD